MDSVTEARTHNAVNELTARTVGQDPQISLTYDDAGNLVQDGSAEGDHQYVWDYRNRLIEVKERQSGNWVTVGEYRYDARTRRVLKVVTNKGALNGTTRFLWGGDSDWQCVEERSGGGDLVARYTYSPGYIDAVAVQERDLNDDQDFGDANEVVYYHSNTLFSVYALTDADESVVERYRYDAYGAATVLDADWAADADSLSDVANPLAFTGRRLDPGSGLMQYRHRYYSLKLGRFLSRDPLVLGCRGTGHLEDESLYAYVAGNPTSDLDPTGCLRLRDVLKGILWGQLCRAAGCLAAVNIIDKVCDIYVADDAAWLRCVCVNLQESLGAKILCFGYRGTMMNVLGCPSIGIKP